MPTEPIPDLWEVRCEGGEPTTVAAFSIYEAINTYYLGIGRDGGSWAEIISARMVERAVQVVGLSE